MINCMTLWNKQILVRMRMNTVLIIEHIVFYYLNGARSVKCQFFLMVTTFTSLNDLL